MRKIYVVGGDTNYANWMQGEIVNEMEEADLVVFTGGEDVSPVIYGESKHPRTFNSAMRDDFERRKFEQAINLNKHIIGICRGSQFSCVMSGGKLVQDQPNDNFIHEILTYDGKALQITSTHHQAQYPWNLPENEFYIIGWTEGMHKYHQNGNGEELPMASVKECEIVFYPKTKALAIQGHPEMGAMDNLEDTIEWLRELLDKHMNDTLVEEFASTVE